MLVFNFDAWISIFLLLCHLLPSLCHPHRLLLTKLIIKVNEFFNIFTLDFPFLVVEQRLGKDLACWLGLEGEVGGGGRSPLSLNLCIHFILIIVIQTLLFQHFVPIRAVFHGVNDWRRGEVGVQLSSVGRVGHVVLLSGEVECGVGGDVVIRT